MAKRRPGFGEGFSQTFAPAANEMFMTTLKSLLTQPERELEEKYKRAQISSLENKADDRLVSSVEIKALEKAHNLEPGYIPEGTTYRTLTSLLPKTFVDENGKIITTGPRSALVPNKPASLNTEVQRREDYKLVIDRLDKAKKKRDDFTANVLSTPESKEELDATIALLTAQAKRLRPEMESINPGKPATKSLPVEESGTSKTAIIQGADGKKYTIDRSKLAAALKIPGTKLVK